MKNNLSKLLRTNRIFFPVRLSKLCKSMLLLFTLILTITPCSSYSENIEYENLVDYDAVSETASALGYDTKVVAESMYFQNKFYKYIEQWEFRFKDRIADAWVEPIPGKKGYVRFKGAAPKEILEEIDSTEFFKSNTVEVYQLAKFSRNQIKERLMRAGLQMQEVGVDDFSIKYDQTLDKIVITIFGGGKAYRRLAESSVDMVQSLKNNLESSGLYDIEIFINNSESQSIETQSLNGGGKFSTCAGSFMTANGVFSAGHCVPQTFYYEYSGAGAPILGTTSNFGLQGDYAHFRLSTTGSPRFNTPSVKEVKIIRSSSSMVGMSICLYSPKRKTSYCGYTIVGVNEQATWGATGALIGHLVKVSGQPSTSGDSGGPWYSGSSAFGTHVGVGTNNPYSFFTALDYAQQMTGFYAEKADACPTC